ncbi:hypothetical protein OF001_U120002 [Pseudomonas sp. OF001]|nr:hypothetical protein OF001_U120002 [Pseudomonas sp. OF001]
MSAQPPGAPYIRTDTGIRRPQSSQADGTKQTGGLHQGAGPLSMIRRDSNPRPLPSEANAVQESQLTESALK